MKSKDLVTQARTQFSADFLTAVRDGDENRMADAIAEFSQQIQDVMMQEVNETSADNAALAARGVRVLTSQENKYYTALIKAMESGNNIHQAITDINVTMPETIIDAVLDDI